MTEDAGARPLLALGYMTMATLSFTLMAVAGRELSGALDTFEIMTIRSAVGLVIVLAIAYGRGLMGEIRVRRLGLHAFRNLSHFTGQNLWLFAVTVVPFSQLFAFEFSVPLWVALLAPMFLDERLTPTRVAAAALGFIGILIVARPEAMGIGPGVVAAALCALGFAAASISTKLLTRTEATISIMFWLTLMQLGFGLIAAGYDGDVALPSNGVEAFWTLLIALCGLLAHYSITSAMQVAPATVVLPMDFARLPIVAVVGAVFYDEPLVWLVGLGASIIFVANFINLRAERRRPAFGGGPTVG